MTVMIRSLQATARRAAVACGLSLACAAGAAFGQSKPESGNFDPAAVVRGITISRNDCARLEKDETAIWVTTPGRSACLRYYAAGFKPGQNAIATIWLNGDVLGPKGNDASKRQSGFGPAEIVKQQRRLSERFAVPSIFLGRPGTYGSAGKHYADRGRPIEADLLDAALDGLKRRYAIGSWSLAGHSGGGTAAAELLARRDDLGCVVISSGAAAYGAYLRARGLPQSGKPTRFDPYAALDRIRQVPERRIFVIGDPRETNVPFSTQELYFRGLIARGHDAHLLALRKSTDARHHDLIDFAETTSAMCAGGSPTARIVGILEAMPLQHPRPTN